MEQGVPGRQPGRLSEGIDVKVLGSFWPWKLRLSLSDALYLWCQFPHTGLTTEDPPQNPS